MLGLYIHEKDEKVCLKKLFLIQEISFCMIYKHHKLFTPVLAKIFVFIVEPQGNFTNRFKRKPIHCMLLTGHTHYIPMSQSHSI